MDSRIASPAMPSRSTSTTSDASSVSNSSPTSRDAAIASTASASRERPWSLRRRMAIAVASSTATQFDEMLQQQAELALRYADHEYNEGDAPVPASLTGTAWVMPFGVIYQ